MTPNPMATSLLTTAALLLGVTILTFFYVVMERLRRRIKALPDINSGNVKLEPGDTVQYQFTITDAQGHTMSVKVASNTVIEHPELIRLSSNLATAMSASFNVGPNIETDMHRSQQPGFIDSANGPGRRFNFGDNGE